jgi:hypothetical protein
MLLGSRSAEHQEWHAVTACVVRRTHSETMKSLRLGGVGCCCFCANGSTEEPARSSGVLLASPIRSNTVG